MRDQEKRSKESSMNKSVFEVGFKAVVIAGLIVLVALQFREKDAIVYVDAVKLLNGYKGMEVARRELEARTGTLRANLDTLKNELEGRIKEYEATQEKLTAKEKALMEELIETKQEQFVNYQNVVSERLQKEDKELTAKVLARVNDYIKEYGEDHGYEIIMAATQYGNIVYAEKGKDITDNILEGLNKELTK